MESNAGFFSCLWRMEWPGCAPAMPFAFGSPTHRLDAGGNRLTLDAWVLPQKNASSFNGKLTQLMGKLWLEGASWWQHKLLVPKMDDWIPEGSLENLRLRWWPIRKRVWPVIFKSLDTKHGWIPNMTNKVHVVLPLVVSHSYSCMHLTSGYPTKTQTWKIEQLKFIHSNYSSGIPIPKQSFQV